MVLFVFMTKIEKALTPTSIILLGATGDLAYKKLLPALISLFEKGVLPEYFYILAFSRDEKTNDEYRMFVRKSIEASKKQYGDALIDSFLEKIEYTQGVFEDSDAYERVKKKLEDNDNKIGMCSSKMFYLAVPPKFYETIFDKLAQVKLEQACLVGGGWTRILVEKPFGSDYNNAKKLDDILCSLFKEEQIYRIDHYLAKDALQNIMAFRFSNVLFEDEWNNNYVEGVCIKVHENFDVKNRGAFFDGVGALRDVGQNHILQMLALIAMERPNELNATSLREKRAQILEDVQIPTSEQLGKTVIKGQYTGYRKVEDVAPESKTETYFAIKAFINNKRWKGVPFYLEHGKALQDSKVEITLRFRSSKNCVCNGGENHNHPNFVRFTISPEQKITLRFWVRKPGLKYELEAKDLVFDRSETKHEDETTDAYEEVLFDGICGDQTLFVSNREQKAAWKFVTAILDMWKDIEPTLYEKGSHGPDSIFKEEIIKNGNLFT